MEQIQQHLEQERVARDAAGRDLAEARKSNIKLTAQCEQAERELQATVAVVRMCAMPIR